MKTPKKTVTKKKVKSVKLDPVVEQVIVDTVESNVEITRGEIDLLTISFPNEDLNKLVEKVNELVIKSNGFI